MAETAADPRARTALLDLHQLFTLQRIAAQGGLLHGELYLTRSQIEDMADLIERSIGRLADQAMVLIDAFDLPERFFAARPIANPDYQEAFDDPAAHWNLARHT